MNIKVKTSKSVEFDTFKKEIKTMVKVSGTITAKGVNIHAKLSSDSNDYISLTDIASVEPLSYIHHLTFSGIIGIL